MVSAKRHFPFYWSLGTTPNGKRKGDAIEWHWTDVEPGTRTGPQKAPAGIGISFVPGYNNIIFNGFKLNELEHFWEGSKLQDKQLWMSLNNFARLSEGKASWEASTRKAQFKVGEYAVSIQPNGTQIEVNGEVKLLKSAPYILKGILYVPVNQLVELLGGKARFDEKTLITDLVLPASPKGKNFKIYEDGKPVFYDRVRLREIEEAAVKEGHQPWRQHPVEVARVEAVQLLPPELQGADVIQKNYPERVSRNEKQEPVIILRKGNSKAEYSLPDKSEEFAGVRLKIDGKVRADIELHKPFGHWWYIISISLADQ